MTSGSATECWEWKPEHGAQVFLRISWEVTCWHGSHPTNLVYFVAGCKHAWGMVHQAMQICPAALIVWRLLDGCFYIFNFRIRPIFTFRPAKSLCFTSIARTRTVVEILDCQLPADKELQASRNTEQCLMISASKFSHCKMWQRKLNHSYVHVNCRMGDSASAISYHSLLVEDYDKNVVIEGCIPVAVCQHKEALIPSRVVSDISVQHLFGVVHLELPQSEVLHNGFPMSPSVIVLLILGKTLCCKLQLLHAHMLHLNMLLVSCPEVERQPWGSDSATGEKHRGRLRSLQSSESKNWLVAARPLRHSWCTKGLL